MSSKKKSKKVFQVTVSEIPEWNKQLAFDGLLGSIQPFRLALFPKCVVPTESVFQIRV